MVLHVGDGRFGAVDGMSDRIDEVPLDEYVDAVVECRREQQSLATLRCLVEQPLHCGQESQICHVVRFVQHGHGDVVESAVALRDQVLESTGAGDHDVDAARQGLYLWLRTDATVDDGDALAECSGEGDERLRDLSRKFSCWHQHEAVGTTRSPLEPPTGDAGNDRDGEGDGLAAAGSTPADDIPASETIRECRSLDREGFGDATFGEGVGNGGGNAERRKVAGRQY